MRENNKVFRICACVLAAGLSISQMLPVYAEQSPTMAYSSEVWAQLRDNNLEFDEIDKLVHEYNPTVLQNALSLNDFLGKTSTDISSSYYDAAQQIYNNTQYPEDGSSNYASGISSYLSSQITYENLMEEADNNTNDEQTYRLTYAKQEAELVKQARTQMISYWSQYYNIPLLKNTITNAENNAASVQLKVSAGTATESSLLTAQQSVTTAKTSLETAQTKLDSTKEDLCLMLGWKYGADVKIGELPAVPYDKISAIDLNSDIEKAKTNNYTLKLTDRQLSNAKTYSVREELTTKRATYVQNIANDVSGLYKTLNESITNLNAAKETLTAQTSNKEAADRKKAAGMITQKDYTTAVNSYESAETQVKIKELAVLTAYVNYESAVNGLASAE